MLDMKIFSASIVASSCIDEEVCSSLCHSLDISPSSVLLKLKPAIPKSSQVISLHNGSQSLVVVRRHPLCPRGAVQSVMFTA